MIYTTELLKLADFSSLILIKLITSLGYLIVNYITHKMRLPVTKANCLRLLVGLLDFMIVITLLLKYTLEWGILAYGYPAIGVLSLIFIFGLNWVILLRQNECVQPVFIIGLLSLVVLVMLKTLFFQMNLGYKAGAMPALMLFNGVYIFCWLVFYPNAKIITGFAEGIGDKFSWVDPLIGNMPHEDVALRNVCSFNLSVLNFTYIHTSLGGAVNIITLSLIGLGLLINILIGLRLIKVSASVELSNSFMVQIIKNGYNNIAIILMQLKNKQLPKATWYAWVITLTMGVTFISPCYAAGTSTDGEIIIDASLQGEKQLENQESVNAPIGESSQWRRNLEEFSRLVDHNKEELLRKVKSYPADLAYSTGVASAAGLAAYGGAQVGGLLVEGTETAEQAGTSSAPGPNIAELENANREKDDTIATQAKTIAKQAEIIATLQQQQKSSWSAWFKSCWKSFSNE